MQSAFQILQSLPPGITGDFWPDLFYTITQIVPHVSMMVIGYLGYLKSRSNGRKLTKVERTLESKADGEVKAKK